MIRGVPNRLMNLDNRAKRIDSSLLPMTAEAKAQYNSSGGNISDPFHFGIDPLESSISLKTIRYESFCRRYSFQTLFCEVSNGCGTLFAKALLFLIDTSYRLSHSSSI